MAVFEEKKYGEEMSLDIISDRLNGKFNPFSTTSALRETLSKAYRAVSLSPNGQGPE